MQVSNADCIGNDCLLSIHKSNNLPKPLYHMECAHVNLSLYTQRHSQALTVSKFSKFRLVVLNNVVFTFIFSLILYWFLGSEDTYTDCFHSMLIARQSQSAQSSNDIIIRIFL